MTSAQAFELGMFSNKILGLLNRSCENKRSLPYSTLARPILYFLARRPRQQRREGWPRHRCGKKFNEASARVICSDTALHASLNVMIRPAIMWRVVFFVGSALDRSKSGVIATTRQRCQARIMNSRLGAGGNAIAKRRPDTAHPKRERL
jgi:hypothetical protein